MTNDTATPFLHTPYAVWDCKEDGKLYLTHKGTNTIVATMQPYAYEDARHIERLERTNQELLGRLARIREAL